MKILILQINDGIHSKANVEDDDHEETNEVGLPKALRSDSPSYFFSKFGNGII